MEISPVLKFPLKYFVLALVVQIFFFRIQISEGAAEPGYFKNPILDVRTADPYVVQHSDGHYYMARTTDNIVLYVYKSKRLSDWRSAENKTVYRIPGGMQNLWSPEINFVRGNWYIYFSMDDSQGIQNQRQYVLRAEDPANPLGNYTAEIRLNPPSQSEDHFGVDGTVLEHTDGRLYFLNSGSTENQTTLPQKLFLAPMANPTTISGPKVAIREPTSTWENEINSLPRVLRRGNTTFIIFTVLNGPNDEYCLGLMGIDDGKDPLVAENWFHNHEGCVFAKNELESVWAPASASFVKSPDFSEDWMMYQATHVNASGWDNVTARVDRVTWTSNGTPIFPQASGFETALPVPSGEI